MATKNKAFVAALGAITMNVNDYTYILPQDRIALHPVDKRDDSKFLVYNGGKIKHQRFTDLPDVLPANSLLFFNDTKVVPARLRFQKDTGAEIEIFLLTPVHPSALMLDVMQAVKNCVWKCTVGNSKRWNSGIKLVKKIGDTVLTAELIDREGGIVAFEWSSASTFADIINSTGETPLPPYLKRKAELADKERYQTVYSHVEGAVAAPTAGLHFTEFVFSQLRQRNILMDFVTLHVSAGTFQPIKVENAKDHSMHREQIIINRKNIENLLLDDRFIVPVGTTSLRTLESIFWYGAKLLANPQASFAITQDEPYRATILPWKREALQAVLHAMDDKNTDTITGESSIFIYPGYSFKFCDGLITNFHQPGSTLILLVAAFVGNEWRKIYSEALDNNYRFLSYGDSSFLIRKLR